MIKKLEIQCDNMDVDAVRGGTVGHILRLDMLNVDEQFIGDLDPMDIVQNQDPAELLKAIDDVMDEGFIMQWLKDLGSM